jgi:hypothetical protein
MGNLTSIEEINLSANDLTGPVPGEFGRLSELKEL